MKTRSRNILILVLSLAVGGGFLFYVLNQKRNELSQNTIEVNNFIAKDCDAYALFYLEDGISEIKEQAASFDGGFAISMVLNQFVQSELKSINQEKSVGLVQLNNEYVNEYVVLIAHLQDSLADLQQSGFVLQKKLLDGQIFIGQHKNLFLMMASQNSVDDSVAVGLLKKYVSDQKITTQKAEKGNLIGRVYAQNPLLKDFAFADSIDVKIDLAQNKIDLLPMKSGLDFNSIFKEVNLSKNDTLKNFARIDANPEKLLSLIRPTNQFKKTEEKIRKIGIEPKLIYDAWNGKLTSKDLGNQTLTTSYITYETDDDFNTIEVTKTKKSTIKAFAIELGVIPDKFNLLIEDLLSKKLIKENPDKKDSYILINVLDKEVEINRVDDLVIISNLPNYKIELKKGSETSPSFFKVNQQGKKLEVTLGNQITIQY